MLSGEKMLVSNVTVKNKAGLHARPVALLAKCVQNYKSKVTFSKGEKSADADSVIKIMLLQAKYGDTIKITVDGPDEESAMKSLVGLIDSKFNEE